MNPRAFGAAPLRGDPSSPSSDGASQGRSVERASCTAKSHALLTRASDAEWLASTTFNASHPVAVDGIWRRDCALCRSGAGNKFTLPRVVACVMCGTPTKLGAPYCCDLCRERDGNALGMEA